MSDGAKTFLDAINNGFLHQMIEKPTRDRYINDLGLTNNMTLIQNSTVGMPFGTSDHKTISLDVHLFVPKEIEVPRKIYLYSKGLYPEMDKHISEHDWTEIFSKCSNIQQMWTAFKKIYNDSLDIYVPHKMAKPGHRPPIPWLNNRHVKRARKKNSEM